RQAVLDAHCSISDPGIWQSFLSPDSPGSALKKGLQLLPIKVRIVSSYDPPFHQKRGGSGHQWNREGGSGIGPVTASCAGRNDVYARRGEIRLGVGEAGELLLAPHAAAGKIRIGVIVSLNRAHSDELSGSGGD